MVWVLFICWLCPVDVFMDLDMAYATRYVAVSSPIYIHTTTHSIRTAMAASTRTHAGMQAGRYACMLA